MANDTPNKTGEKAPAPAEVKTSQEQAAPKQKAPVAEPPAPDNVLPFNKEAKPLTQEKQAQDAKSSGPDSKAKTPEAPAKAAQTAPGKKEPDGKDAKTLQATQAEKPGKTTAQPDKKAVSGKKPEAPANAEKKEPQKKADKSGPANPQAGKDKSDPTKPQADKAAKAEETPPLENPFMKPSEKTGAHDKEAVTEVDIEQIHPFHTFRAHPYKVKEDEKMRELVESVESNGVMQPGLARPEPDGNGYELIAGHRRRLASQLAHKTKMPVIIREMTDLEAVRAMKDSNKQRDEDLPSERAALLDLELEAIKHQGVQDVKNVPPELAGKRS
ncbi:MAG TPA: chromosome partitioning protein ParB, partial [Clostridiales bacterium]|nr:chromosome partitioning protein ParB [Clostridiales bacterium]